MTARCVILGVLQKAMDVVTRHTQQNHWLHGWTGGLTGLPLTVQSFMRRLTSTKGATAKTRTEVDSDPFLRGGWEQWQSAITDGIRLRAESDSDPLANVVPAITAASPEVMVTKRRSARTGADYDAMRNSTNPMQRLAGAIQLLASRLAQSSDGHLSRDDLASSRGRAGEGSAA